jgi:hypothetical protein
MQLRPVLRQQAPAAVVLLLMLGGFVQTAFSSDWLRGVLLLASGPLLAGVLRLVLTESRAGLLAVRARWFDVACYLSLGVLAVTLGLLLPR